MDCYTISAAARMTGFTPSALRFYEKEGVVVPDRSPTGYRSYRHEHVESLRFVARGKQLGLNLGAIAELLALLEDDECDPVQSRIRELVTERTHQAQTRIAELVEFTAQLQRAAATLGIHTPDGACDDDCGCRSDPDPRWAARTHEPIPLVATGTRDVSCSLDPQMEGGRIQDWNDMLARATAKESIPNGIRMRFADGVDTPALAALAAAEQSCCSFFGFAIGIGPDGVSLDVTGPAEAQDVIASVFGAAA